MTLPTPLLKYIDSKSLELVDSIQMAENPKSEPEIYVGSINEKISLDWSDKIDTSQPMKFFTTDSKGQKMEVWLQEGDILIGFSEEPFKTYLTFINSLYKKSEFNSVVGQDFLESTIFDWLIQTYKNKQASTNLSQYIIQEIEKSIETKVYCFPILYFDIDFFIQLGPVTIKYFTESNFDEMDVIYERNHGHKRKDPDLRDKYQGMVVAPV